MPSRCISIRKALPVLLLALLPLTGCVNLAAPVTARLRGLQYNNIVQGNAERANYSADFAKEQTCPAATPFRTQARVKANQAQAAAEESAQLSQELRDLLERRGQIVGMMQSMQTRLDQKRAPLEAAYAEFASVYALGEQARLRDAIPAMDKVAETADAYGREMLAIADEFEAFAINPDNQGVLDGVFDDPAATATDLRLKAEEMKSNIQLAGNREYSVPENPRSPEDYDDPSDWVPYNDQMRLVDFKIPDGLRQNEWDFTDEFDSTWAAMTHVSLMGNVLVGEGIRSPAQVAVQEILTKLEATGEDLLSQMSPKSDRITELADQSRELAAEATRQAWLAHEACGGELPEDFPDVDNPFDDRPTGIPDWSSTFWDISSP